MLLSASSLYRAAAKKRSRNGAGNHISAGMSDASMGAGADVAAANCRNAILLAIKQLGITSPAGDGGGRRGKRHLPRTPSTSQLEKGVNSVRRKSVRSLRLYEQTAN